MRANLLARWVDISNIAPEQLIALSDEVGAKAFEDIYQNKQATLNAITAKQEAATAKLNQLKESGAVAEKEYNNLKATIDSTFAKTKQEIQRAYVNDIFGIADTARTKKQAQEESAVNTIETFLKNVPATEAAAFRSRYSNLIKSGKTPAEIVLAITKDPEYIKKSTELAKSAQAAASAKATLEQKKIEDRKSVV